MFIVYDILFFIFSLLYIPHLIMKRKWHKRFVTRLGFFNAEEKKRLSGQKNIWIHAVSVGEVLAVLDIIQDLKNVYPKHQIVCSTVTKTGYKLALEKLSDNDIVIYAPFDFSLVVRTYVKLIRPVIYIATETEIWPNLFRALKKKHVPIIIVNGRISEKSFKGYRMLKPLMRPILNYVDVFCMQSQGDLDRIQQLGAEKSRGRMVGNLKFDAINRRVKEEPTELEIDKDYLIGGSTHPGEEDILIDIYKQLVNQFKNLRLIIVPRHVERVNEVAGIIEKNGLQPVKWSESKVLKENQVMVVDQIGVLKNLYAQAKLVFIGKSFTVGGAQNMIEPLAFGKPTFVGPRTENFTDVMRIFLEQDIIFQVQSPEEMLVSMKKILAQPQSAHDLGDKAKKVIDQNRGARAKTIQAIQQLVGK